MDDLVERLRGMLDDPATAQMLSGLAASVGNDAPPTPTAADDGGMAALLTGMLPLLSGLTQDDDNTALLRALRPHLHGGREKRLDEAIRLLQLLKFVPLLQGKGGLGL